MKEFKGTPGPWEVTTWTDQLFAEVANENYHQVSSGRGFFDDESKNGFGFAGLMSQHDANLIAAAPDLLEALQAMLSKAYKQNWNDQYPDEVSKAQAAISKALGE